jgi:hypothetical protein
MAEPHKALGSLPLPSKAQGFLKKKKKKIYKKNTLKIFYVFKFAPTKFFFSILPHPKSEGWLHP